MMSGIKVEIRNKKLKHLNVSKVDMSVERFSDMEVDSRASNSRWSSQDTPPTLCKCLYAGLRTGPLDGASHRTEPAKVW